MTLLTLSAMFMACSDYETYADKKEKERNAIKAFIAEDGINVISEEQFKAQNYITNADESKNEFVYLNNSGVYMQIVRKGCGKPLQDNERADLLVRFMELNIMEETFLYNDVLPYGSNIDIMTITRAGSTYTASFTKGTMRSTYGESVPPGWLVPFNYINVGRDGRNPDDEISKVRLIVPHTQGHTVASSYVRPYYYEITFERKIDLSD